MRTKCTLCIVVLFAIALIAGVAAADTDEAAVVDRMGSEYATLLYETEDETAEQRLVALDDLPEEARYEGSVVRRNGGSYEYDAKASEERRSENQNRLDELSERV